MKSNLLSAYNPNRGKIGGNYGPLFYGITALVNPEVAVEIGVCQGYSAMHIAQAIKDCDSGGILVCYDLWEDEDAKTNFAEEQKGKHLTSTREKFESSLKDYKVEEVVKVYTSEAFDALYNFAEDSIDMIHLDIGNCGDVIYQILPQVLRTLKVGGYFLFEGGADHRDEVEWMIKHDKRSIAPSLPFSLQHFRYLTFYEGCSLTVCRRIR